MNYKTIDQEAMAEYKDRGSRFVAIAFPCSDIQIFKQRITEVKKQFPKADHFCYAYRMGINGTQYRSSDDREPAGTAGKPILGQLLSKEITNTAIIVVRFFGGTLLGVPGLINAYKNAASLCLQLVPIIQKPILLRFRLEFDYTLQNDIMRLLKQVGADIQQYEQGLFCSLVAGIPLNKKEAFVFGVNQLSQVEMEILAT